MNNIKTIKDHCVGFFKALCVVSLLSVTFAVSHSLAAEVELNSAEEVGASISLNTADVEALATLEGVGQAKAAAIVQWREQNGGFSSIEQLSEVKGIGAATLERNRHKLSL